MAQLEEQIVIADPDEVEARLARMGLTRALLFDALRQGELARRMSSPLDPPIYPGIAAWSRSVRALRENLASSGWTASNNGISTVVSPDKKIAIAVVTGAEGTGLESTPLPATRHPRGSATVAAIRDNQQLELFETLPGETNDELSAASEVSQTWLLMFRSTADGITAELSCPKTIGANGHVSAWSERIVLGVDNDGDDSISITNMPNEGSADPDIQVIRRV